MNSKYPVCKVGICLMVCHSLITVPTLSAQPDRTTSQDSSRVISDITVSARHIPSNMSASAPLQSIDRKTMERMGALEVSDAVRHFAGISVKDYGGIGGLKTISVRSMGAQHTGVTYDGVAIGDCQSGQVDISRFSLANVSQLTMSIGQSDNIYQSARTFASAGVLHIETAQPVFDTRNFNLNAMVRTGSFGLLNPSLLYNQKINDRHSLSFYGDLLRADGNYPFTMRNGNVLINSKRNNSDILTFRTEANYYASLTDRQSLNVKAYLFDSRRGLPGGIIYDNPYAVERLYDKNYFGQFRYENRFNERLKLKVNGKYNYSWTRDYNNESSGITDNRYRQTEADLSAVIWGIPLKGLQLSLAQDFSFNHLSDNLVDCKHPSRYTLLSVLAARYNYKNVTLTVSLLNTFITERVQTGVPADDREKLSPAFSVSWKPFNRVGLRLRASYKDIFRNPTFNDLYYLVIGNTRLRPETTRQGNMGITWTEDWNGIFRSVSFSADAYYNIVNDKIIAVPTMFVWKMSNIGKVETIGTDLTLAAELCPWERWSIFASGSYNFMQAEDITSRQNKTWRQQIAYTPRHSGSGSVTLEMPWCNLTYNVTYASERYTKTQNSPDNRIKPYADHGLSLSKAFHFKGHRLRIQADALNLAGYNYEVIRYYPMPGRHYKLTLNYQL